MSEQVPEDQTVPENMKGDLNDPSEPDQNEGGQHVERQVESTEKTESEAADGGTESTEKSETVKERLSPDDGIERNPVDGDDPRSRNYEKDL